MFDLNDITRIILIIVLILLLVLYFWLRFALSIEGGLYKRRLKLANDFFEDSVNKESEGNYVEAVVSLDKAIKLNNQQPEYFYFRAIAKSKLHGFKDAIKDLTSALLLKPDRVEFYEYRMRLYKEIGDYKNAYKDAKYVTVFSPENISAHIEKANIASLLKDNELVLADLNQALRLAAKLENAKMVRAISLKIKKYEESV